MTAPRKPGMAPPRYYRPRITARQKLRAALRAAGVDPDQPFEWDHVPPIHQRLWDPFIGDTMPPAGDDAYIFPIQKAAHREKTAKRDIPDIAKTKRLAKKQEAFRAKMLKQETPEPKSKRWASRPFQRKLK